MLLENLRFVFDRRYTDRVSLKSDDPAVREVAKLLAQRSNSPFERSIHVRMVDAGSPNDVELEEGLMMSPRVDAERFGIHFVASPRHADVLLATGPVTQNMRLALEKTYEAVAVNVPGNPPSPYQLLAGILKAGKALARKDEERKK